jgi:hypothetical protein
MDFLPGYGASWRRALYRGFPVSVPDIVKKYPRAPRSTVTSRRGPGMGFMLAPQETIFPVESASFPWWIVIAGAAIWYLGVRKS